MRNPYIKNINYDLYQTYSEQNYQLALAASNK